MYADHLFSVESHANANAHQAVFHENKFLQEGDKRTIRNHVMTWKAQSLEEDEPRRKEEERKRKEEEQRVRKGEKKRKEERSRHDEEKRITNGDGGYSLSLWIKQSQAKQS